VIPRSPRRRAIARPTQSIVKLRAEHRIPPPVRPNVVRDGPSSSTVRASGIANAPRSRRPGWQISSQVGYRRIPLIRFARAATFLAMPFYFDVGVHPCRGRRLNNEYQHWRNRSASTAESTHGNGRGPGGLHHRERGRNAPRVVSDNPSTARGTSSSTSEGPKDSKRDLRFPQTATN
jgi:hypothetical protein